MIFKVLILDDDYINRMLLISFLKKALYQIDTIESIDKDDALEQCKKHNDIQLIIVNIEMSNIDGSAFIKSYKQNDSLPDIPIIAISSNDLRVKEIIDLGASAFVIKPVTEKKLLSAIIKGELPKS